MGFSQRFLIIVLNRIFSYIFRLLSVQIYRKKKKKCKVSTANGLPMTLLSISCTWLLFEQQTSWRILFSFKPCQFLFFIYASFDCTFMENIKYLTKRLLDAYRLVHFVLTAPRTCSVVRGPSQKENKGCIPWPRPWRSEFFPYQVAQTKESLKRCIKLVSNEVISSSACTWSF